MRYFLLLSPPFFLSACSLFSMAPSAEVVSAQLLHQQDASFAYGIANGATKKQAVAAARQDLASQIYVHVSSEFKAAKQQVSEHKNGQSSTSSSEELESYMANHTSVLLNNVEVENTTKVRTGWIASVKMPRAQMQTARLRTERQAPALAYALLMNNQTTLSTSTLLRYAIQGLEKTLQQGIADEVIYTPGVALNSTFETFFKSAITNAKEQLTLLPITDADRIRFALINKQTYAPQSDFVIDIAGTHLRTDHSGFTRFVSLDDLPKQFSPILLGYSDIADSQLDPALLKTGAVNTSELSEFERTQIYVYTEPSNALVTLMNGSKTLDSKEKYKRFTVSAEHNMLKLLIETLDNSHGSDTELIGTPSSANLYYSIRLSETSFGTLNIAIEGRNNSITLKDANDDILLSGRNQIVEELEVGRYHIHIENEDSERYQSIDDSFTVYKNSEFKREYKPLINRRHFHRGAFTDLNLGYGSNLNDHFEIPLEDGSVMKHKAFLDAFRSDYPHNYALNLRRMRLTNAAIALSYGLDLSARHYQAKETDDSATLYSAGGHLGVGLWTSKLLGETSWITANYNYSYYDWHISASKETLRTQNIPAVDSFTRGFPFVDIGTRWEVFGIGARLSDPSIAAPSLYLSIGATRTETGHEYDAHSTAIKGAHF